MGGCFATLPPLRMRFLAILASAVALGFSILLTPTVFAEETSSDVEHRMNTDILMQEAEHYVRSQQILDPEYFAHPSSGALVTRLTFTRAVIGYLYTEENFEDCFQNIAPNPSEPVRFTHLFRDIPITAPYAKEICVAIRTSLIDGKSDGSFRANEPITIAEASKILAKAYGLTYPAPRPTGKPWYDISIRAMKKADALPEAVRPASLLTAEHAMFMFYQLRNQERYPIRRVVGLRDPIHTIKAPASSAQPAQTVATTEPTAEKPETNIDGFPSLSLDQSQLRASTYGVRAAMSRISRRTMLRQIEQELTARSLSSPPPSSTLAP